MAATESLIVVGAKNAHTYNRTIGANSVEDEAIVLGEYPLASYSVTAANIALATAASHHLTINAGATLPVRIRKIVWRELTPPAAVTVMQLQLFRTTTAAPTGGTVVTPRPLDSADAASGCTAMTLPTVKATEGVQLEDIPIWLGTLAIPISGLSTWEWTQHPGEKPIIIPAGVVNGLAFKNAGGVAAATCSINVELVETNFV